MQTSKDCKRPFDDLLQKGMSDLRYTFKHYRETTIEIVIFSRENDVCVTSCIPLNVTKHIRIKRCE